MAAGGALLIAATCLAAVLSLAFRYRRAPAAERAQLKWLVYACALIVVAALAGILAERIAGPDSNAANNFQNAVLTGAAGLVPVSIGIAILRYRLYDIDRVISRTWPTRSSPGCWPGSTPGWCCWPPRCSGSPPPSR
jgi:uncharacterized membrane protein YidH (DUF202 family)